MLLRGAAESDRRHGAADGQLPRARAGAGIRGAEGRGGQGGGEESMGGGADGGVGGRAGTGEGAGGR